MRLSWTVVAVAAIALAPGTGLAFGDKFRCRQPTGYGTTTVTGPTVVTTRTVTTGTVLGGTMLTGAWFPTPNVMTGTTFTPTTLFSMGSTGTGCTSTTDALLGQLLLEQQKTNSLLTTLVNRGTTVPPPNNGPGGGVPAPNTIAGLPATVPLPAGTPRHVTAPLEFNAALASNQPGRALDIYAWAKQQTDAEAAELKKNQDANAAMLSELQRRGIVPK